MVLYIKLNHFVLLLLERLHMNQINNPQIDCDHFTFCKMNPVTDPASAEQILLSSFLCPPAVTLLLVRDVTSGQSASD